MKTMNLPLTLIFCSNGTKPDVRRDDNMCIGGGNSSPPSLLFSVADTLAGSAEPAFFYVHTVLLTNATVRP